MKKILMILLLSLFSNSIFSQAIFQKIYGQAIYPEGANDIQKTFDGGYMIGGYAYRPQTFGSHDLYLLKIDNAGVIQYGKLWGRTGYKDAISSFKQTSDSGYILLTKGQLSAGGNFNSSLIKTNNQGVIQWNKYFQNGTSSMNNANVEITSDGGFMVATSQYIPSVPQYIVNLQKMDANGDTVWTRVYNSFGGIDAITVKQTTDNGYVIGGEAKGAIPIGKPLLLKIDSTGNIQWYKTYTMTGLDLLNWYEKTSDGGFIMTGTSNSYSQDSAKIFVLKTDSIGNPVWSKLYETNDAIYASKIMETNNGEFLITGNWLDSTHTNRDVLALKLDVSGNLTWSKRYGGPKSDLGTSLLDLAGNGYMFAGYYGTPNGAYPEVYLLQTDLNGNSGCNDSNVAITSSNITSTLDTIGIIQYHLPYTISTLTYNSGSATDQTTFCSTVGINNFDVENDIRLFPNPASDFVEISFPDKTTNFQVSIVNNFGKEICKRNISSGERIDTNGIANGLYYLRFLIDQKMIVKKLLIIR